MAYLQCLGIYCIYIHIHIYTHLVLGSSPERRIVSLCFPRFCGMQGKTYGSEGGPLERPFLNMKTFICVYQGMS